MYIQNLESRYKFAAKCDGMKEVATNFLENSQGHWDLDTQQRATEYLTLINSPQFDQRKDEITEKLPPFPQDFLYNSVILRSLEQLKQSKNLKIF